MFLVFAGGLAVEGFVPFYVTGALGRSREIAAFSVTFMALGWTLASIVVSRLLDRISNTQVMLAGGLLTIPPLAVGLAVHGSTATPVAVVAAMSLLQGDDTEVSNLARSAIAAGYRASHIVSLVLSLGAVVIIVRLHRWAKRTL